MLPPSFYIQKYFSKGVIFRACLRKWQGKWVRLKSWNQNQFCSNFDRGSSTGCKSHKGLISKIQLNLNCCNPTQVYYTTWANTNYTNNFAVFYSQYIFNHITIKLFFLLALIIRSTFPFLLYSLSIRLHNGRKLYYFYIFKFRNTSTRWITLLWFNGVNQIFSTKFGLTWPHNFTYCHSTLMRNYNLFKVRVCEIHVKHICAIV